MYVNVAILKETMRHERRVAVVPAIAARLVQLGCRLHMRSGAGEAIHLPDAAFKDVAAVEDDVTLVEDADLVLAVQPPTIEIAGALSVGSVLVSFIYPDRNPELLKILVERRITCFAMERLPRITRAQGMDALSSQAALAGYYAVGLGLTHLSRVLSKMTTAAGTIGPAKVLVIGLGVAGLEAIATAQRLGAVVEGYDVRPDTAEQALSLGATFVETGVDAHGEGGYARALSADESAKVAEVLTRHIQASDLVITTAAIPGRQSPKLVSSAQAASMRAGSVIVDLSAEGGGNCEDTRPGETTTVGPVTIVAPLNVPSLLGADASDLYARNVFNLLALFVRDNIIAIDWSDAVLVATVLTRDGESFASEPLKPLDAPAQKKRAAA